VLVQESCVSRTKLALAVPLVRISKRSAREIRVGINAAKDLEEMGADAPRLLTYFILSNLRDYRDGDTLGSKAFVRTLYHVKGERGRW
jgi:hypothetical protein